MGFWRSALGLDGPALSTATTVASRPTDVPTVVPVRFGSDIDSGVLYGTPTLDDYIFRTGRITRAEALRVPAVKRARDLICGAIGQFNLKFYDPAGKAAVNFTPNLFQQPEIGIAKSVTWTRVIEDMLLDERSWLPVTNRGWHGLPITVQRMDPESVTVQPQFVYYPWGTASVWPEIPNVIRIDSPNAGILTCSPAVKACILLQRATLNAVDGTPPIDYFTPNGEGDPLTDTEIIEYLDDWAKNRRERTTGYIPAEMKYNVAGWDPDKLQLAEVNEFAITEIARLTGIDAEELSVSTTSRSYFNGQDRRRARIEDVLGPYMTAVEGRLSMNDVSPRGYTAAFDTSGYLRLDDLAAAQTDSMLIAAKILTPDEARAKRGLEPLGDPEPPDPAAIGSAVATHVAIESTKQGARRA